MYFITFRILYMFIVHEDVDDGDGDDDFLWGFTLNTSLTIHTLILYEKIKGMKEMIICLC